MEGFAVGLCRSLSLITLEKFICFKRYPRLSKTSYFGRRTSVSAGGLLCAFPRGFALVGNAPNLNDQVVCFKGWKFLIAVRQTPCYGSRSPTLFHWASRVSSSCFFSYTTMDHSSSL